MILLELNVNSDRPNITLTYHEAKVKAKIFPKMDHCTKHGFLLQCLSTAGPEQTSPARKTYTVKRNFIS